MEKAIKANPIAAKLGEGFQLGTAYSYTVKKDYSYLCMWMTSSWLERNKTLIRCGKYSISKTMHFARSSQEFGVGIKTPKNIKVELYSEVIL